MPHPLRPISRDARRSLELQQSLFARRAFRTFMRTHHREVKTGGVFKVYRLEDTLAVVRPSVKLADFKLAMREQYKREQQAQRRPAKS